MNIHFTNRRTHAFSLVEVMVVVAVIAIISAVFLSKHARDRDRARRISCIGSLKITSMGLRLFANDADGAYPFQFLSRPTNSMMFGSAFKTNDPGELWKLIQVAQNDIASARVPICPGDRPWRPADSFLTAGLPGEFAHTNSRLNALSYFLSPDADESDPSLILMGDRYLTTDPETSSERKTSFLFGQQDVSSGASLEKQVRWISTVHQGGGNAAFMDGSVQQLTTAKLREAIVNQPAGRANRIWLPNSDATGRGNP